MLVLLLHMFSMLLVCVSLCFLQGFCLCVLACLSHYITCWNTLILPLLCLDFVYLRLLSRFAYMLHKHDHLRKYGAMLASHSIS